MSSVADRLRTIMPGRGDAPSMARATGIPNRTIQNWLNNRGEPDLSDAVKIARAAGVSLEWLATGEGPMRPASQPAAGDGESPGGTAAPPPKRAADELLFDEDVLVQVLQGVEIELAATPGLEPTPEDKARLAAAMYRLELRRLQRPGTRAEARAAIRADLRDVMRMVDVVRGATK